MSEGLQKITEIIAVCLEFVGALLIALGAILTLMILMREFIKKDFTPTSRGTAWLTFARWIVLGLEFTLGADIIRSAVAPTWTSIGQLAAIAVIRTFLNFFLERDIETLARLKKEQPFKEDDI